MDDLSLSYVVSLPAAGGTYDLPIAPLLLHPQAVYDAIYKWHLINVTTLWLVYDSDGTLTGRVSWLLLDTHIQVRGTRPGMRVHRAHSKK